MALVEVIKYDGGPDVFAWKFPQEDIGTWSQLIVNESQEAVFLKGGQVCDVFTAGRYTLSTQNIPVLSKLINLPFGGNSPFAAEVWFVNKAFSLDVKWGTATPIQLQDPKYKIFTPVRSYGQFGIRVSDPQNFLIKLVGTLDRFDKESLTNYFRGLYLTKVKDAISSYLVQKEISVLEINAYLEELSDFLQEKMKPAFDEYGINLVNFFVNDINVPEDDPGVAKLKAALAKRAEMDILGYNYVQERSFDTLEGAATNPGQTQSGLMGAGMGLGMGLGVGGTFGNQMGGISNVINTENTKPCPSCGAQMGKAKRFCGECGFDTEKPEGEQEQEIITCSNCGSKYTASVKFCPECGDAYNPCPSCKTDLEKGTVKCEKCGYVFPKPCPHCGAAIENGNAKFCPECGQPLIKRCGKCGTAIEGDPKFCPECGNALKE